MPQTQTQKEWLESFGHFNVKPIRVTITVGVEPRKDRKNPRPAKTLTCEGCSYQSEHFAGETRLMLLSGEYKALTKRKCFTREDSEHEWFVAGYAMPELAAERPEQNPFGPSIIVSAWNHTDQKIDHYEEKPYKRLKMQVEYL